jgi:Protein of unknown function (DUF2934)
MKRAQEAESAYRRAFEEFSKKVQQVQALIGVASADPKQVETALLDLERAHVAYIARRDEWVQHLLPTTSGISRPKSPVSSHEHDDCIRVIAEMLWESAGRPEGTSDRDWHKAEEIVRLAGAAA